MPDLHTECLTLLHHDLLKALVCGKRIPQSSLKELCANFNLLHLFVVSGVHVYFLESRLKRLTQNTIFINIFLTVYGCTCNFSAPILRVLVERFIKNLQTKLLIHIPTLPRLGLSFLFCLPISLFKDEFVSLSLSFYFSLLIKSIFYNSNLSKNIVIFLLAHPIFIYGLGLPSFYSVFVISFSGYLVGHLLLPLAFLSLISESVQHLTIHLCWQLEEVLQFIDIFFNYPKTNVNLSHSNFNFIFFHSLTLIIFLTLGHIFWKRKTLFL